MYCDCRMYYYLERLIEKRKESQKSTQLAIESIYVSKKNFFTAAFDREDALAVQGTVRERHREFYIHLPSDKIVFRKYFVEGTLFVQFLYFPG